MERGALVGPEGGGGGLRGVLEIGRDVREEVESGAGLDGVDGRYEAGVIVLDAARVGLVGHDVGDAPGGAHRAVAPEGAFHDALIEVRRDGDVEAAALERPGFGRVGRVPGFLIEHAGDDIEGVAAADSRGVLGHVFLEAAPDAAVEAVLPLGRLVGAVEGLLVLLDRALAVVGGHEMAAAVADAAGVVKTALLREVDGRVVAPGVVAARIVVRPQRLVHGVGGPDGGVLRLVEENGVVARLPAGGRVGEGMGRYLTAGTRGVVAVPDVVAVAVRAAGRRAVEGGQFRHFVAVEIADAAVGAFTAAAATAT